MTIPYAFQIKGRRQIHRFDGRCLVAWSMGLGKSFLSLYYAQHKELFPAVVICPATLKWNWEHQAAEHIGMRAEVLEGLSPKVNGWTKPKLVIVNYDILGPRRVGRGRKQTWHPGWLEWLIDFDPKLVIIDESQNLIDPGTIKTKATKELCKHVPHVLALSGTPIINRPIEIWPTLNILQPRVFHNRFSFGHRYCGARKEYGRWTFKGATRLSELRELLNKTCMIRLRTEDVLQDLPPKTRHVVPLEITNREEYNHAFKDFLGWLNIHKPGKLSAARKAEQLTQMSYLKKMAAEGKLQAVFEWVDSWLASGNGKIILFCTHISILLALHERYKSISTVIYGKVKGKKRQLAFDTFLSNKKTRLLVGQLKAAGVGLSAKGVSEVAFIELGWNPASHSQAEARCRGIGRGQKDVPMRAWYLIAKGTLEEPLVKMIQTKQKHFNKVMDGKGRGDSFDIYDRLCIELQKGDKK